MERVTLKEKFIENIIFFRKKITKKITKKISYKLKNQRLKKIEKFSNERIKEKIVEDKTIGKMLQIYVNFISTNVFFSAIYKTKGISNERLGLENLKNRAMKLKEPVYIAALYRFVQKIDKRLKKVKIKIPVIIRLRGKPYKRQVKILVRTLDRIKPIKLIWIENYNSMIFKSGLREKKVRRV